MAATPSGPVAVAVDLVAEQPLGEIGHRAVAAGGRPDDERQRRSAAGAHQLAAGDVVRGPVHASQAFGVVGRQTVELDRGDHGVPATLVPTPRRPHAPAEDDHGVIGERRDDDVPEVAVERADQLVGVEDQQRPAVLAYAGDRLVESPRGTGAARPSIQTDVEADVGGPPGGLAQQCALADPADPDDVDDTHLAIAAQDGVDESQFVRAAHETCAITPFDARGEGRHRPKGYWARSRRFRAGGPSRCPNGHAEVPRRAPGGRVPPKLAARRDAGWRRRRWPPA